MITNVLQASFLSCRLGQYQSTQMPKGIPVANVAIGNTENADLLAVRILATRDPELWDKYGSLLALFGSKFTILNCAGVEVPIYVAFAGQLKNRPCKEKENCTHIQRVLVPWLLS